MDEGSGTTANDVSGNGNHGTLVGATFDTPTGDGSASSVLFNSATDYVDLGNLDVNGSGITLAAWVNAAGFPGPSNDPRIISKATDVFANDHVFMLGTVLSGGGVKLRARLRIGGTTTTLIATHDPLTLGVWYHAAMSYDGVDLKLFLDGVEVGTTPLTGTVDTDPAVAVVIGNQSAGPTRNWDGHIDDARVYQRGLSESEVNAIIAGNQPPVAVGESYNLTEDGNVVVDSLGGVLPNDSDPEALPLSAVLATDVSDGVLNLNADGSFDYTPDPNFFGQDSFTYYANDGQSNSNAATVTLNVAGTDDQPLAVADDYQTQPNTPLNVPAIGVLGNDFNPDLEQLWAVLIDEPAHGALTLNSDGSFDYTPDLDYNGLDQFMYRVRDSAPYSKPDDRRKKELVSGAPTTDVAIVTISVVEAPEALDDNYNTNEDSTIVIDAANGVLDNDSDNNPPYDLTAAVLVGPAHGTLISFDPDGAFTYQPDPNANGVDSFTYEITEAATAAVAQAKAYIDVASINDPPVAVNENYQTQVNAQLVVNAPGVLGNDTDVELTPLQAVLVDSTTDGTLSFSADGSFTYDPDLDFEGADSFTYRADDGEDTSNLATVTITVTSAADPDLLVHLPLDQLAGTNAPDVSGFGNDGTLTGGAVFQATSADGSPASVDFDGIDDRIELPAVDVNGTGLTLACWFNGNSLNNAPRLISKATATAGDAHVFMLGVTQSASVFRLRARIRIGGTATELIAPSGSIAPGEWRHAALTYDGTDMKLYLNGAEVATTGLTGAVDQDPAVPVAVGAQPPGAGPNFLDGRIDDVRIYQRALAPFELAAIVNLPTEPIIDVWYGDVQNFGQLGNPQDVIQIPGRVRETAPISSVSFRLNGGASQPLNLGPDGLRLVKTGDYNIEIDLVDLNPGANTVEITATDINAESAVKNVTVNYTSGVVWPMPTTITWTGASAVTDVSQVCDGQWYIDGDYVRTVPTETGYDRLLVVGDYTWIPDYEIEGSLIVHSIQSSGSVGFAVGWQGHRPPGQPLFGHPYQAIGWITSIGDLEMLRNAADSGDAIQALTPVSFVLGTEYRMKIRSETLSPTQSNVKIKWWEDGTSEPGSWDLDEDVPRFDGSVLIIGHQADCSFGPLTIDPLGGPVVNPPVLAEQRLPERVALHPNSPNPFNPSTMIAYDVPSGGADVQLAVYDVQGRLVRRLVDAPKAAGTHRVSWDGRDSHGTAVATGVYFYRMRAAGEVLTRKMLLLK